EQVRFHGISFAATPSPVAELLPGQSKTFFTSAGRAGTLALVSTLSNSLAVADGQERAVISIACGASIQMKWALRAGRDTAEWAYDRNDVRWQIKHSRPVLAESWAGDEQGSFKAHSYLAILKSNPALTRCETSHALKITSKAQSNVVLSIKRIAFHDQTTGDSMPVVDQNWGSLKDEGRWQQVNLNIPTRVYGGFRVYENLQTMPRVWL